MLVLPELFGESAAVAAVRQTVERLLRQAGSHRLPPILIQGETGTGKGLLAHLLHRAGPRRDGPFVHVNCAAIPDSLIEAELFGFERGAFTDARQSKPGLFQTAHAGTLFLDEVGLLREGVQGKLLIALEERAVRRLGSTRAEPVDVAILAATSEDLETAMRERRFHEALYHRLSVVVLRQPPLRERGSDTLLLAEHFLLHACKDYKLGQKALTADAQKALLDYRWPGNVRELANLMERVALLSETTEVTGEMLGLPASTSVSSTHFETRKRGWVAAAKLERETLVAALARTGGNITQAATHLGIPPNTLRYRLKKHGLLVASSRPADQDAVGAATSPLSSALTPPLKSRQWERRFLTTLKAELVALPPTAEFADVDPTMRTLLEKVRSFGGRVEEVGPTGLVAVFGLDPVEDAARRAANAAMTIQKAVERLRPAVESLSVKIVIHMSSCLVGLADEKLSIDLDAKRQVCSVMDALLARGEPGTILVSAEAATVLERRFNLIPRREGDPIERVFQLVGNEQADFRMRGQVTKFVGRDDEIQLLRSQLNLVTRGHGQVVGVAGEAGIGKSRLLFQFRKQVAAGQVTYLEGQCHSYATDIPCFAFQEILRNMCRIAEDENSESVSVKVRRGLSEAGMDPDAGAPYLVHLLGASGGTGPLAEQTPEVVKARTFETLRQLMILEARRCGPTVVAIEDLHWIDQTSEELLSRLVADLPAASILLLLTYRPGYRPRWIEKSYATQISLSALSPTDSRLVVEAVCQAAPLPEHATQAILERAEGNPLFLEELAWALLEHEDPQDAAAVPDTLQEVLLARIRRLPPDSKRALQLAATLGRDCPRQLLEALWQGPLEGLLLAVGRLAEAEFLYQWGVPPQAVYRFKHALVQEVAYQALPKEERQQIHRETARVLEERFPEICKAQPELLAHHYTEADLVEQALLYWQRAGQRAIRRSANVEALSDLNRALKLLDRLPATSKRTQLELELQMALGSAASVVKGAAASEVEHAFLRAFELSQCLGDVSHSIRALSTLATIYDARGELQRAQELGEACLALAQRERDPEGLRQAHQTLGRTLCWRGQILRARAHLEEAFSFAKSLKHDPPILPTARLYPQEHSMMTNLCMTAVILYAQGYPDQARRRCQEAVSIAEKLSHSYSLTATLLWATWLHIFCGETQAAHERVEDALALAIKQRFPLWEAMGIALQGWTLVAQGQGDVGIAQILTGLSALRGMRVKQAAPSYFVLLAEAYGKVGRITEGLCTVDEALAEINKTGARWEEAPLYCVKGNLLLARATPHSDEPELCFQQALTLARGQQARSFELRAAVGLAGVWLRHAKREDARELLAEVYGRFTEGFDTADLRAAKDLLAKLE